MRVPDPNRSVGSAPPQLSRKCAACEEQAQTLQTKTPTPSEAVAGEAPPIVHQVLRSAGQPLDPTIRAFMEPRFGYSMGRPRTSDAELPSTVLDFSQVRIHADDRAAASARAMNALAYTVGHDVVFAAGRYAPQTADGRKLLAHELTHVVQQSRLPASGSVPVRRTVVLKGAEMPAKDRRAFLNAHKWTNARLAASVMEDMAAAGDKFDFASPDELQAEITKRSSTVRHMEESQETEEKIPGDKRSGFGYPFTGASALYGPRVNYAARDYWEPGVPDNYAVRTDKAKNTALLSKPRRERCTVYGDQCGDYGWKLSDKGKKDPYHAIAHLFAPQQPHKRTLIHCDYLISLVNFMSLADTIGPAEFNKRVAAFGADKLFLKWNAFSDLHTTTFERTSTGELAKPPKSQKGFGSTQRVTPASEADLVIGDHVVFFNHLAYDLINQNIGNAWRLENTVLVSRHGGKDVFLGHGSGYMREDMMRGKLAQEFNLVAKMALGLIGRTKTSDKKAEATARSELTARFPNVKQVGNEWHAQGVPLLLQGMCPRPLDEKVREIKPSEVLGPRSPCDPSKMYEVERPIESAK
jgi:hypothetical protein